MKANTHTSTKRKEAEDRNAKWAALSPIEQLDQLDKVFGKDKGAAKQRVKIAKKMVSGVLASAKSKSKSK